MKDKNSNKQTELEQLKLKCEEYLNGWQRAQADYANFKKETDKRMSEISIFAKSAIVAELVLILDNFAKAVAHVPAEQKNLDWVVGLFHIKKQLEDFLAQNGLEKIKTVGEEFDHNLHEAVGKEPGEKDKVIKEVSSGFKLNGQVILPAKVIVGYGDKKNGNK